MRSALSAIAWIAIVSILVVGLIWADRLGERKDTYTEPPPTEDSTKPNVVELSGTSSRLVGLQTAVARKRDTRRTIRVPCQAQLDANHTVLVRTLVSGFVEQRLCEQGSHVRAGDALFVMRSNDLALAKGAYLSAKAQLELARGLLDRDETLVKDKIVSQSQFDTDRAAWLTARSAFVNAREQLFLDGLGEADIDAVSYDNQSEWVRAVVKSPIDGDVVQLTNAHARGDLVPSGTDLCQVGDLARVWVIGSAYEKDIAFIRTGSTASLSFVSYPGRSWTGSIEAVADFVNPTTRTVDVRAVVENRPPAGDVQGTPARFPIKPGLFGSMELACDEYPAGWVWIPQAAILPYFLESGEKVIFVATDDSHFVERHVRIASEEGPEVAVVGPLAPGERVVTEGNIFLARKAEAH